MPKSYNQKLKLLYVLNYLMRESSEQSPVSAARIIEHLAANGIRAERKSIYDDIEALKQFGYEINKSDSAAKGYYMTSPGLEVAEIKMLADAVRCAKFISASKSRLLIDKLTSRLNRNDAEEIKSSTVISNRVKSMNDSVLGVADHIHHAINSNKAISFRYYERDEKKQKRFRHGGKPYNVSPFALVWNDENYYMIGFDGQSGKIKHYRADKMTAVTILDKERDGKELFERVDLDIYTRMAFGMYGGEEVYVTLRCANRLAGVICDRFGEECVFRYPDTEHFEVTVRVMVSPLFLTWIMSFYGEITVISPEDVALEYKKIALIAAGCPDDRLSRCN